KQRGPADRRNQHECPDELCSKLLAHVRPPSVPMSGSKHAQSWHQRRPRDNAGGSAVHSGAPHRYCNAFLCPLVRLLLLFSANCRLTSVSTLAFDSVTEGHIAVMQESGR